MQVLSSHVASAAGNLEHYHDEHAREFEGPQQQAQRLIALTRLTLEELAGDDLETRIEAALLPLAGD